MSMHTLEFIKIIPIQAKQIHSINMKICVHKITLASKRNETKSSENALHLVGSVCLLISFDPCVSPVRIRTTSYYCILIRSNDKIRDFVSVAFSRLNVCAHTTHSLSQTTLRTHETQKWNIVWPFFTVIIELDGKYCVNKCGHAVWIGTSRKRKEKNHLVKIDAIWIFVYTFGLQQYSNRTEGSPNNHSLTFNNSKWPNAIMPNQTELNGSNMECPCSFEFMHKITFQKQHNYPTTERMLIERVARFNFLQKRIFQRKTTSITIRLCVSLRLFGQFSVIQLIMWKLTFLSHFDISSLHLTLS